MAHLVFGNRFSSTRPEWHKIGNVIAKGQNAVSQIKPTGLDYLIHKKPLFAELEHNRFFGINDRYAIMREPTNDDPEWRYFAHCGSNYEVLQNADVAQICDIITDKTDWTLETIGALEQGKTLFLCYAAGSTEIAGDQINNYFFVYDRRDGTSEVTIASTKVRVVCWNTCQAALRNLATSVSMRHTTGLMQEFSWRMGLLNNALKAGDNLDKALRNLATIEFTLEDMDEFVIDLFPYPKVPKSADLKGSRDETLNLRGTRAMQQFETKKNQADTARRTITNNFKQFNDEFPRNANTGWGAFQSVTQYVTHQIGANSEANRAKNSLFGAGVDMRTKAYELIIAR
jgi:phage/plasmid-like protein (TIGR03299 family)